MTFTYGTRRIVFVPSTGNVNTTVLFYIKSEAAARGNSVSVLVHRQELVDQVSGSLGVIGMPHCFIAGGCCEMPEPVQVASVACRLDRTEPFDLLVSDEAHHAVAGS